MSGAWRWLREHAVNIVAGLVVLYMLIPIAVILVFSFNDPAGKYNFTWVGFTLSHWGNAFGIPELNSALLDEPQTGAAGDADLDRDRDPDGARAGPPPVPRPARARTC